jgi:hypothetical protein
VVSTTDAHTEDDPEFAAWPPHCVAGTLGQRKPEATLLDGRMAVPNRECELGLDGARQIVLEKQTVDVFQCRNIRRLIERLNAASYVVYGVVTEIGGGARPAENWQAGNRGDRRRGNAQGRRFRQGSGGNASRRRQTGERRGHRVAPAVSAAGVFSAGFNPPPAETGGATNCGQPAPSVI